MTPTPQIDPVSVAVALIGTLIGAELAKYVGPYLVIGAAGLTGSGLALMRRPPGSRVSALAFVSWLTVLSILLTVPVAEWLASVLAVESRWMLAPVAGAVAGVGHDWPRVGEWLFQRLARLIERRTGSAE